MKTYSAYLIRCWRSGEEHRYVVQHVQSGLERRVTSLAEATQWIEENFDAQPETPGEEEEA